MNETTTTRPSHALRMEEVEQVLNFISARRVEHADKLSTLRTELGEELYRRAMSTSTTMLRLNALNELEELIRNEPLFNK